MKRWLLCCLLWGLASSLQAQTKAIASDKVFDKPRTEIKSDLAMPRQKNVSEDNDAGIHIVVGAERLSTYLPLLEGKNIAIVANQTSLVGGVHLVDTLLSLQDSTHYRLSAIFCPEHGFRGTAAAGALVNDSFDSLTRLPVVSLYGKNKKPTAKQLEGIDLVIFDLQDVGCRFYTYISTLHYVMEACAENHIQLLLLDRPNPNAHYVDGPVLDKKYQSFVGMHPVPIVYGMTIGEYAQMINGECWLHDSLQCDLTIVCLSHYSHDSAYRLPVPPSPNLRTPQAIALYPSLCLFEGTTISVGRGTPYPFEVIGNDYKMDLRSVSVPAKFDLRYLQEMYQHTPKGSFFLKNNFFEKLAGTDQLRKQLQRGDSEESIRASWEPKLSQFKLIRAKYLLYQ